MLLARTDGSRLFSNLTRGNHYLVQAEGYLNNSGSGQTSEMALIWNRTLPGKSVSTGGGVDKKSTALFFSHFSSLPVFCSMGF